MKVRDFTKLFMGLAAISFLNVACQGNLQSDPGQSSKAVESASSSAPIESTEDLSAKIDMKAVQASVDDSKVAMEEAQKLLASFSNPDGSIKIWSLMTGSTNSVQSQSIFIIYEKLSELLNKVYDKVALVKQKNVGFLNQLLALKMHQCRQILMLNYLRRIF